jgi:hypothetical protein
MALGLGGIVPQLVCMARARSAAGQSPSGWAMGVAANLSMGYVNGVAFHATMLSVYALSAAALCSAALALTLLYGGERAVRA